MKPLSSGNGPRPDRARRQRLLPGVKRPTSGKPGRRESSTPAVEETPSASSAVDIRTKSNGPLGAVAEIDSDSDTEANSTTRALIETIEAVIRAETVTAIVHSTLEVIRRQFGWIYGSYWTIDPEQQVLTFAQESGEVDAEFHRITRSARFREGEGLNGRSWQRRDLVHVQDLGELADCCRAPVARRGGIRSGIALPLLRDGQVIGTLDFFASEALEITPTRLDALRVVGKLASDKIAKLSRQEELVRVSRMIENSPTSMIFADRSLKIRYLNPASERLLKRIEAYLPCKAEEMVGQSIDIFHKNPAHQQQLLANPRNLPHRALIRVGPEHADLLVSAIVDHNGEYLGPMLTWDIVTEKILTEAREAELAADTTAVNQLLTEMGRAKSEREVVDVALGAIREAFGWCYGTYWELDPKERVMRLVQESGTVGEEFRRMAAESRFREGEGIPGMVWRARDLVVITDPSELKGHPRASLAARLGLKSAAGIPILRDGAIVGVLDFSSDQKIVPSEHRLETLRSVGRLVSSALERAYQETLLERSKRDLETKVNLLMKVAQAAAQGNLTVDVEVRGEDDMGRLGDALGKMMADLKHVIGQVIESANQFAEGSRVVAESASYLSDSSQNQAATVEEMSASVDHLSHAILEINRNAGAARELADRTSQLAKQGGESVDQAIEAMVLIRKSSEQVSDIIQVISEIASQTNLLALNAAIEAARAGEHGLGFAVVADEVRKLAERSRAAAKEITSLIKESTHRVADGAQLSQAAGQSLKTIVHGVEETAASIAKIAQATQEQSESAAEVGKAIQNVSSITETNASSSEELSASAEELGAQASALKAVISGFKV